MADDISQGDIISQGDEGEPGPWPRRLAVLAVLVMLAVVVVRLVSHSQPEKAHNGGVPVAAGLVQLAGLGDAVPVAVDEAGTASLPAADWPASEQLLLSDGPAWYWPATGRLAGISGLPGDRSGYVFSRVDGGWAVQPAIPARGCRGCGGMATRQWPSSTATATRPRSPRRIARRWPRRRPTSTRLVRTC